MKKQYLFIVPRGKTCLVIVESIASFRKRLVQAGTFISSDSDIGTFKLGSGVFLFENFPTDLYRLSLHTKQRLSNDLI